MVRVLNMVVASLALTSLAACVAEVSDIRSERAEVRSREVRSGDPLLEYPRARAAEFPRSTDELIAQLAARGGASGRDAVAREGEYFDSLRTEPGRATTLIVDALRNHSAARDPGLVRLQLTHALFQVADPAAMPYLTERIAACPPDPLASPPSRDDDPGLLPSDVEDERVEVALALDAFERIAIADRSPEVVREYRAVLDRVIDAPACNHHATAVATMAIIRYADDPAAERARLERRLGSARAHLTRVELRHDLPADRTLAGRDVPEVL